MTNASTARRIVLAARPQGRLKPGDFRLEAMPVPEPGPGQVLLEIQLLSLDPYMRGRMDDRKSYANSTGIGDVMPGETVCRIARSNHSGFAVDDIVRTHTGWQSHAVSDGAGLFRLDPQFAPVSTGLGVLGMPGFTAYGGLAAIGKPVEGETVVVAAASGPVGSLVGQLARMKGAWAVGIAGGPDKCRYIVDELGFDAAIDHRLPDFAQQLAGACPGGVDVYFENVGGAVWQAVLPLLNKFARVPVCGLIAQYQGAPEGDNQLAATMREVLTRSLTLRGFINVEFTDAYYSDFQRDVGAGIKAGRIRYREDFVDGLESAPGAFMRMLDGGNFGKLLVRLHP